MDTLLSFLVWLLPLIYLALAIDYGVTFVLRTRIHVRNTLLVPVIIIHLVFLGLWSYRLSGPPLFASYEVLSVIVLSSIIVYWAVELVTKDRRAGVFVLLLLFIMQYTSSVFMASIISNLSGLPVASRGGWGRLHVLPASLAYAALGFSAVYAMLYLLGRRNLRLHRIGLLFDRLPPLELLGKMSWLALLGGFVLITITMLTGMMLFRNAGPSGHAAVMEPKVAAKIIIGSIAWLLCLVAILGKYFGKWSASTISRIAVVGALIITSLFITSAILS